MIVVPGVPVPVSQKRPASWAFNTRRCLGFTENAAKNPLSGSPVGENRLLMRGRRRMARIVDHKQQITEQYNSGVQNGSSERTTCRSLARMGYCSRRPHWVPLLSAKKKKKRLQWAYNNTEQLRSGKTLPGPTNPGSWYVMLMAESGFGVSSMSPWPHPAWCQRYRLVTVV